MFGNSQSQNAGNNSNQVQANNISVYNLGITEQRARQIFDEKYMTVRKELAEEAWACGSERIKELEERLLRRIAKIEGAFNIFADPAFQILLLSAQKSAVASERKTDYEMLAELLACRIEKGGSRKNRVGIAGAIEVVYNVDDDALCALTAIFFLFNFVPVISSCKEGLHVYADTFEKLLYSELPTGDKWLDHLDILKAIRINTILRLTNFNEWIQTVFDGYTAVGINKNSHNYEKALGLLASIDFDDNLLVTNDFLTDYVKLPVACKTHLEHLNINGDTHEIIFSDQKLLDMKKIQVLNDIWDLYSQETEMKEKVVNAFLTEWDKYPALKKLRDFYEIIPYAFTITQIGIVLAYTNAKRCDNSIPDMLLE